MFGPIFDWDGNGRIDADDLFFSSLFVEETGKPDEEDVEEDMGEDRAGGL